MSAQTPTSAGVPKGASLLRREVLPFLALLALLIGAAIAADFALDRLRLVWIGRYLGIPGALLIVLSFLYSLRKRRLIAGGNPGVLLKVHEILAWTGSLMVIVHAGYHFSAVLPWLAAIAMIVNVGSGLTGKLLLDRARHRLAARRQDLLERGATAGAAELELFWDAVAVDVMKRWRSVHFPITLAFAVLACGHVATILMFWPWR